MPCWAYLKNWSETRPKRVLFKIYQENALLGGTLSLDPKGATLESRKHSCCLLLSHSPGHFQENRRDSLSSPSRTSSPWKSEDFNPYRQNRILTHAKEMSPTCPQSLRYNHLLRGDQIQAPGKGGLPQPTAGTLALQGMGSSRPHRRGARGARVLEPQARSAVAGQAVHSMRCPQHRSPTQNPPSQLVSAANPELASTGSKKEDKPGSASLPRSMEILCGCATEQQHPRPKQFLFQRAEKKKDTGSCTDGQASLDSPRCT